MEKKKISKKSKRQFQTIIARKSELFGKNSKLHAKFEQNWQIALLTNSVAIFCKLLYNKVQFSLGGGNFSTARDLKRENFVN